MHPSVSGQRSAPGPWPPASGVWRLRPNLHVDPGRALTHGLLVDTATDRMPLVIFVITSIPHPAAQVDDDTADPKRNLPSRSGTSGKPTAPKRRTPRYKLPFSGTALKWQAPVAWPLTTQGRSRKRREWDSNPRRTCARTGFRNRRLQPLSHLSTAATGGELSCIFNHSTVCAKPPSPTAAAAAPPRAGTEK